MHIEMYWAFFIESFRFLISSGPGCISLLDCKSYFSTHKPIQFSILGGIRQ